MSKTAKNLTRIGLGGLPCTSRLPSRHTVVLPSLLEDLTISTLLRLQLTIPAGIVLLGALT